MTLAEVIYEKSRELPEEKAREVIDFIDFLKTRRATPSSSDEGEPQPQQREALARLDQVRIDFGGKPMLDREAANARD
ncbi:MAG: DUF2281 domain-containing protein [Myxococcales bacterium]|nr:DUF2281 domain-containing protein [Myxococcales bacterium]